MLNTILIENLALIDKLSLDFAKKFNVLSGETGAGKSIIIDALGFVLGAKTGGSLVKQGKDFVKVTAEFTGPFSSEVKNVFEAFDIALDDQIIISRKHQLSGKGDIRLNGEIITQSMLKTLSASLVDIHGQHEHQRLLNKKCHIDIIDGFMKDKTALKNYQNALDDYKKTCAEIKKLNGSTANQERMLDLLDYQITEIENAEIKPNEDEILEKKKTIMQNSEKIFDGLQTVYNLLDNSTVDGVKQSGSMLNSLVKYDESLGDLATRLDSIKYDLMDIANTVKDKKDECNFDEYEFNEIDTRLDKIKTIKKKYGPTLDEVFAFLEKSQKEFDLIKNSKALLLENLKKKDDLLKLLLKLGGELQNERKKIAHEFEKNTTRELNDLGMKSSKFLVDFGEEVTLDTLENRLTDKGIDDITFMFSANAGQNLKPLADIISGGEASRFMLALKNILAENDNINLMVFDEIDTGISGEMGYKVACKLANISRKHQVISVSHLPQICAMADENIVIAKSSTENETVVTATNLTPSMVLSEIARLAGGSKESNASLEHAKELKQKCNEYKKSILD